MNPAIHYNDYIPYRIDIKKLDHETISKLIHLKSGSLITKLEPSTSQVTFTVHG